MIIRAFMARTYPKKEKIYLDEKEFKGNDLAQVGEYLRITE
jgi:hypothetical protein